jgi:hypothetical protein
LDTEFELYSSAGGKVLYRPLQLLYRPLEQLYRPLEPLYCPPEPKQAVKYCFTARQRRENGHVKKKRERQGHDIQAKTDFFHSKPFKASQS